MSYHVMFRSYPGAEPLIFVACISVRKEAESVARNLLEENFVAEAWIEED